MEIWNKGRNNDGLNKVGWGFGFSSLGATFLDRSDFCHIFVKLFLPSFGCNFSLELFWDLEVSFFEISLKFFIIVAQKTEIEILIQKGSHCIMVMQKTPYVSIKESLFYI